MSRLSIHLIWTPEFSHVCDADIVLACMNTVSVDKLGYIEIIIDDKWCVEFLGELLRFASFFKYLLLGNIFTTQLDNIGTELESSTENIYVV